MEKQKEKKDDTGKKRCLFKGSGKTLLSDAEVAV